MSYKRMTEVAGAGLLFPFLLPLSVVLMAYVRVAKAYSRRYHREYQ